MPFETTKQRLASPSSTPKAHAINANGISAEKIRPVVPWLRRTEYISSEGSKLGRRVSSSLAELPSPTIQHKSPDQLADVIEKSFALANQAEVKHPTKPSLKAVEMLPVFPDFDIWPNRFAHCVFEDDPTVTPLQNLSSSADFAAAAECMDQSFLKAVVAGNPSESNPQLMIHFIPSTEELDLSKEDAEHELHCTVARKYDFSLQLEKQYQKLFLISRPGKGVFYKDVHARVLLKKRRVKTQKDRKRSRDDEEEDVEASHPTDLIVKRQKIASE
jgi:RNA polymerase II-associated factor 1